MPKSGDRADMICLRRVAGRLHSAKFMASGSHYFSGFDVLSDSARSQLNPDGYPQRLTPSNSSSNSSSNRSTTTNSPTAAVVCVHGFTAMTYEVMPVARACADVGLTAIAPLLPGHGYRELSVQKQQFGQVSAAGYLSAVRTEIARARERYDLVGLYGHSMGGAIALILAAEGLVDACSVSAPALKLPGLAEWLPPFVCWIGFTRPVNCCDPFYFPSYRFHHSYAVRALWKLSHQSRKQLSQIACPVLGIHTHYDQTIPPVVLKMMQREIPGKVETAWFDPSSHAMTCDVRGADVSARVADFFQQQFFQQQFL